ncbi:MAG: hypothetical protein JHC25_08940 [Thermodesulfobacterium sp.]|jgi:hypothetical protein|nr:hypothetical protein [Thermodesulfobacterium sp.]
MFKADWWKEKGYSEEYSKQIAKGVRALAREIKLREEDVEGLVLLLQMREKLRPSLPLKEFLGGLLWSLIQRQGVLLSESAKKGFLRFYKEEELEEKLNALGEALLETQIASKDILGEVIKLLKP